MSTPAAFLQMYDWPEVRPATDALWSALRDAFRASGIDAPDALDRNSSIPEALKNGNLLLGQICGLPYVQGLNKSVTLLGAPDYGVPGCAPGEYRSVIMARTKDSRENLKDFKGSCFSMSAPHSQSGYAAMLHELVPLCDGSPFFSRVVTSGGHGASIKLVASGAADIAAIDYVSWRLARRFMPEAADLKEIMLTAPVPGLPLVAAGDCDRELMQHLVRDVLETLDRKVSQHTEIIGFRPFDPEDYEVVARRFNTASKAVRLSRN